MASAYPLSWPLGRPLTTSRRGAAFNDYGRSVSMAVARQRLQDELDRIGAKDAILSTNVELRLDGAPRSGQPDPADPGAALYFKLNGRDTVLAVDRWNRVADNIVAIAKHIDATRAIERYGVGSIEQAFAGYAALPAPESVGAERVEAWWQVLGCTAETPLATVEAVYRKLAMKAHPDHGGTDAGMARLNAALDQARQARA